MIFKNETREVGYTISGASAFTLVADNVALGTRKPDGTLANYTSTSTPAVSVSNPGSAVAHTLLCTLSFEQAGVWRLEWAATIGAEVKLFEELYFVAFNDIWSFIRTNIFNTSSNNLPDSVLDPFLAAITLAIVDMFPCIGSYDSLTWPDTFHFDRALAYLVGEAIYRSNPAKYPAGAINQITQGPVTYKYNISGLNKNPAVDIYAGAISELNQISCIKLADTTFNSASHLYCLYGRSRAIKEVRGVTIDSSLIAQLSDVNCLFPLIPQWGWYNAFAF